MKLLFTGVVPGKDLQRALWSSGFQIIVNKNLPDEDPAPELVAFAPKSQTALKELTKIRKRYPYAFIAIIVDKNWLQDSGLHNHLLQCDKNAVWLNDTWEELFWLSLQQVHTHSKVSNELETLRTNHAELSNSSEKLVEQLEKDVGLATDIQRALLPKVYPEIPGVSIAVKYIPAAGLGGDYYDIFEFGDRKRFGVLLADSQTHGMAAALLSVLLKVRLEEMKDRFPDSRSFVEYINHQFQQMHQKELAPLSLLYGILDRASLSFQYTIAGSLRPLLWRSGEQSPLIIASNPPLGGMDHYAYRQNEITLRPGDLLILHSNGLEAPLAHSHPSALERLAQVLKKQHPSPDPLEVQNELMGLVDHYLSNQKLEDDLTLIHFAVDERALYVAPT